MYRVADLYRQHGALLGMELVAGTAGLKRLIRVPEVHRPGLSLSGYLKSHAKLRILVFGKVEVEYVNDLDLATCITRLEAILGPTTPAVIVARRYRPPKELVRICDERKVPLFRVTGSTMSFLSKLTSLLNEEFAKSITVHGTLVEVYGVGVLLKGDSSIGKSEAALGLIERGHRLISDDVVKVKKREAALLEGSGVELTRHHMEIRGIGIVNIAQLYGADCVQAKKSIDLVVELEAWNDERYYDRVGVEACTCKLLGVPIPSYLLPVKPGRDVVLLVETIALNHRLKLMGYDVVKEFGHKWNEAVQLKRRQTRGKRP